MHRQIALLLGLFAGAALVAGQDGRAPAPRIRIGRRKYVDRSMTHYEQRIVSCSAPDRSRGETMPSCTLQNVDGLMPVQCSPDTLTDDNGDQQTRWYCNLNCPNARRMLEILKTPHSAYSCVRFYTYDSERRMDDWYLWLDEACFESYNVDFSLWCEFAPVFPRVQ